MAKHHAYERLAGADMGIFTPVRFSDGTIGYQSVDPDSGSLFGILWSDGRYEEPGRNGNLTWEICEETPAHRRIIRAASREWDGRGMDFVPVT